MVQIPKYNRDGLRSLEAEIKRMEQDAMDAFWDGNDSYGEDLQSTLEEYYKLREQGELYIPEF